MLPQGQDIWHFAIHGSASLAKGARLPEQRRQLPDAGRAGLFLKSVDN